MSEQKNTSSPEIPIPELLIIVCFISFLVWILTQNFSGSHTSSANACINNLRQIDAAANEFALEHNLTNDAPINFPSDLTPYIKLDGKGNIPSCPQGGKYHIGRVGKIPTCSLGTSVTPEHVLP